MRVLFNPRYSRLELVGCSFATGFVAAGDFPMAFIALLATAAVTLFADLYFAAHP